MARTQHEVKAREGEEVWEITTPGRVWLTVTDDRGRSKSVSVGGTGKPGARIRISTLDREMMQDSLVEDRSDPFVNGMLKRVDGDQNSDERTASDQALTSEELAELFEKKGNAFQSAVKKLNELNVRRLREMAEPLDAAASQIAFLDSHIEEHYRAGGDTPTYRELKGAGDTA